MCVCASHPGWRPLNTQAQATSAGRWASKGPRPRPAQANQAPRGARQPTSSRHASSAACAAPSCCWYCATAACVACTTSSCTSFTAVSSVCRRAVARCWRVSERSGSGAGTGSGPRQQPAARPTQRSLALGPLPHSTAKPPCSTARRPLPNHLLAHAPPCAPAPPAGPPAAAGSWPLPPGPRGAPPWPAASAPLPPPPARWRGCCSLSGTQTAGSGGRRRQGRASRMVGKAPGTSTTSRKRLCPVLQPGPRSRKPPECSPAAALPPGPPPPPAPPPPTHTHLVLCRLLERGVLPLQLLHRRLQLCQLGRHALQRRQHPGRPLGLLVHDRPREHLRGRAAGRSGWDGWGAPLRSFPPFLSPSLLPVFSFFCHVNASAPWAAFHPSLQSHPLP